MGQFAKDWTQLKTLIRQKDDALEQQAAQIATLQKQLAAHQQTALDTDDLKAVAELGQTVGDNPAPATPAPTAPATHPAAATPAPALAHPATPAHPPTTPVTTFKK